MTMRNILLGLVVVTAITIFGMGEYHFIKKLVVWFIEPSLYMSRFGEGFPYHGRGGNVALTFLAVIYVGLPLVAGLFLLHSLGSYLRKFQGVSFWKALFMSAI